MKTNSSKISSGRILLKLSKIPENLKQKYSSCDKPKSKWRINLDYCSKKMRNLRKRLISINSIRAIYSVKRMIMWHSSNKNSLNMRMSWHRRKNSCIYSGKLRLVYNIFNKISLFWRINSNSRNNSCRGNWLFRTEKTKKLKKKIISMHSLLKTRNIQQGYCKRHSRRFNGFRHNKTWIV